MLMPPPQEVQAQPGSSNKNFGFWSFEEEKPRPLQNCRRSVASDKNFGALQIIFVPAEVAQDPILQVLQDDLLSLVLLPQVGAGVCRLRQKAGHGQRRRQLIPIKSLLLASILW